MRTPHPSIDMHPSNPCNSYSRASIPRCGTRGYTKDTSCYHSEVDAGSIRPTIFDYHHLLHSLGQLHTTQIVSMKRCCISWVKLYSSDRTGGTSSVCGATLGYLCQRHQMNKFENISSHVSLILKILIPSTKRPYFIIGVHIFRAAFTSKMLTHNYAPDANAQ